jgi:hypothetical protein
MCSFLCLFHQILCNSHLFQMAVVNRLFLTISCLVIIQYQKMAEKIKINLSNGQKKLFLKGPLKIGKVVRL